LRKNPALEDAEQYALVSAEEGKSACTGGVHAATKYLRTFGNDVFRSLRPNIGEGNYD
jgi:hypothetical protein